MDSFAISEGLAAQERHESQSEPVDSKLSEETTKFQRAIAAWRSTFAYLDPGDKLSRETRLTSFK
jgi:hypothetical protein